MKKKLLLMLTFVILVMISVTVPASAYSYFDDYYYDDSDSGINIGQIFIVSVVAGLGISFVLVSIKKSAMKTVKPEKTANEYVQKDSLMLTARDDVFIREHTTRTPRQRNNR